MTCRTARIAPTSQAGAHLRASMGEAASSPIHVLLWTYGIKPAELEVFSSTKWPPNGKCVLTTDVAESWDGLKIADLEDDVDLKIYMDGLARMAWPVPPPYYTREVQS